MVRFLSAAWFDELARHRAEPAGGRERAEAVVTQVVTGTPDGDVAYQIVVEDGAVSVRRAERQTSPLAFTSDYLTAAAIARGELSTQAALLEGRLRVSGNSAGMAGRYDLLAGIDLVPAALRAATTY